jgi:hypothetical protein
MTAPNNNDPKPDKNELDGILGDLVVKVLDHSTKRLPGEVPVYKMHIEKAKTRLSKMLVEAKRKAVIAEIDALYARAENDTKLVAKLDKIYQMRYINLGGGNVFIIKRLKTLQGGIE